MMLNKEPSILVYRAEDFLVSEGVAWDDPLRCSNDLILDDVYQFRRDAAPTELHLSFAPDSKTMLIAETQSRLICDACLTLITPHGISHEVITFKVKDTRGRETICFTPLSDLDITDRFRLIDIDTDRPADRMMLNTCGAFGKGTQIAIANRMSQPIEDLQIGDLVLTRDHGLRPVKHIVHTTMRAQGQFAPVVIKKGAIQNKDDLILRPGQHLFVDQAHDHFDPRRQEILLKAEHLLNGRSVYQITGGYVDYVHLLFDEHCMVQAEGLWAEAQFISSPKSNAMLAAPQPRPTVNAEHEIAAQNAQETEAVLRRAAAG